MGTTITTAAPADTATTAAGLLAYQSQQTGTSTDVNIGSQIRTLAESIGAIAEQQGVIAQALALQAMVYGACAAFGVTPLSPQGAVGTVTFMTGQTALTSSPAQQAVTIQAGFVVQTDGAVQFSTTTTTTLALGATGVDVPVQAVQTGPTGNVQAGLITTLVSNASYPLYVTNSSRTASGANAETSSQTLSRLLATIAGLRLGTPIAIASFCIGISAGAETVRYATVNEPWIGQAPGAQKAGFEVYLDNGSGMASAALIAAVKAKLDGALATQQSGCRAAGVPYAIYSATTVPWSVSITATLTDTTQEGTLTAQLSTAINAYQAGLLFGQPAEASQLTAAIAGALAGYLTSLQVLLLDQSGNAVQDVTPSGVQRALLGNIETALS